MANKPGSHDYTDGSKKGEKPPPSQNEVMDGNKRRWWTYKGSECAQSVASTVDFLQKAQTPRIQQQVINQALYGNRRLSGVQAAARSRMMSKRSAANDAITYNAVQSIVDTATSKIGETKPRPYFLTSGGNYKQQRKAKRLNKYVEGVFYENKTYDLTPEMFRSAAIDGDGLIYVHERGGKIRHEVVSSLEIWIDEEEGQYGRPRNWHRNRVVDRDELAGEFSGKPEVVAAIKVVAKAKDGQRGETVSDMVSIVESWHLGSMQPDGSLKGGKYAISLLGGSGFMLVEPEDWPHDFFPFARLPWCKPPMGSGFWSQSLAGQLQGEQVQLNKLLQLIQRSMHLAGNLIIWTKHGSKLVKEHINNEIGSIISSSERPEFFCPEPIHQVFFEEIPRIIERMERKAGTNELSIAGKKPPGIDSGRGLRELEDQQSDRFKTTQRQYDSAHLQLAEITVALSIEAAEAGKLDAVRVPGKQSFDTINFKDDFKGLKRSEFTLHCYSVSRLPKDPAGRLQTITEHIAAGIISLRQGRKLLDFPDLEAFETLADAQENLIAKILDAIVDDGEYAPPDGFMDLTLAKEMVTEYVVHYMALELEDERMDDLRSWSLQVDTLLAASLPAAMAQPMNPAQAVPEAPPTSDLLPQMPQQAAA